MPSERVQRQMNCLLDEAEEAAVSHEWEVVHVRSESVLAIDPHDNGPQSFLEPATRSLNGPESLAATELPGNQSEKVASTADQPASFAEGRYLVQNFPGECGKRKVYQAHDELLGGDVASAPIKTEPGGSATKLPVTGDIYQGDSGPRREVRHVRH